MDEILSTADAADLALTFMRQGDRRDYRAMLARELERRHAPVAKQVTARIVIERQIDDEQRRAAERSRPYSRI